METEDVPTPLRRRDVLIGAAAAIVATYAGGSAIRSLLSSKRKDVESLVRSFPTDLKGARRTIVIPAAGSPKGIIVIASDHPPPLFLRDRMDLPTLRDSLRRARRCSSDVGRMINDLQTRYGAYTVTSLCVEGFASDQQHLVDAYMRGDPCPPVWEEFCGESIGPLRRAFRGERKQPAPRIVAVESRPPNDQAIVAYEQFEEVRDSGSENAAATEAFYRTQVERENHIFDGVARCDGDFVPILFGKSHDAIDAFRRCNGRRKVASKPPLSGVFIAPDSTDDTFVDFYWDKGDPFKQSEQAAADSSRTPRRTHPHSRHGTSS